MLNAIYRKIDWDGVINVGFDMDGTLYDEYEFIEQVYSEINREIINDRKVLSFMLQRWLEKGSSYTHIFEEAYKLIDTSDYTQSEFIEHALSIFRTYKPQLMLTTRNQQLLQYFRSKFNLFLITDGNTELQQNKFHSLMLNKYFADNNVFFTGKYSPEYHKPNIKALDILGINHKKSVFFGDRRKDKEFALSAGMQFQKVYNMVGV